MIQPRTLGFTMIELLIVMSIIGILASIALPSYQDSARKAKRAEATTSLFTAAANLERIFSETNQYANTNSAVVTQSDQGHYTLAFAATNVNGGTNNGYTLTATPGFTDSGCGNFTLNQNGTQGCTGSYCSSDISKCW